MKRIIKTFTAITGVCLTIIFSLVIYGEKKLPDLTDDVESEIIFSGIYKIKIPEYNASPTSKALDESAASQYTDIKLFGTIPVKNISIEKTQRRYVAIGGELIGIRLKTKGVLIVGTEEIICNGIAISPSELSDIKIGDSILKVDGQNIATNDQLSEIIKNSDGNEINVEIIRDNVLYTKKLKPVKDDITGEFRCGIWIRDSTGGIGTLTYIDPENGAVGTLGHGIYDVDTKELLNSDGGVLVNSDMTGIVKGSEGNAGEIRGYLGNIIIGEIMTNNDNGLYGLTSVVDLSSELYPVAKAEEVNTGKAQILSTVTSSGKNLYDIEIEKINTKDDTKNFIIRITDEELLNITGGIIQGMSGSPIIQNGYIVGAVTHVFLNEPTRGYGILIENMLKQSDISAEEYDNAA